MKDFLIEDATLGVRALQKKIKEHHKVHIHYKRVYMGKQLALKQLYGDLDSSLTIYLCSRHKLRALAPRSLVSIEHYNINGKIRFRRLFFALKPCVDGFISGCRPYLE